MGQAIRLEKCSNANVQQRTLTCPVSLGGATIDAAQPIATFGNFGRGETIDYGSSLDRAGQARQGS